VKLATILLLATCASAQAAQPFPAACADSADNKTLAAAVIQLQKTIAEQNQLGK